VQLEHSFTVPVGIEDAWRILLDIELIGPCMPGAAIDSVDGDDFTGTVKVKLGPINLTYKGKASFVEKDVATHRAVIDARGRDARGNGTAAAKVTATLTDSDGATRVDVLTDLDITGKPAQFGRGVMVDVGNKLIGQFADRLAETIGGDTTPAAGAEAPGTAAKAAPTKAAPTKAAPAKKAAAKAPAKKAATKQPAPRPVDATSDPAPTGPAAAVEQPTPAAPLPVDEGAPSYSVPGPVGTDEPAPEPDEEPAVPAPINATDEASAPSYGVPGAIPVPGPDEDLSVNGHSTSKPRAPRGEVEPIDLLQSAGPAIAKRVAPVLAPVAVAAVVVLVAVRRRRAKK
jgi:carbon monoxide dehydrogenase subunit G